MPRQDAKEEKRCEWEHLEQSRFKVALKNLSELERELHDLFQNLFSILNNDET